MKLPFSEPVPAGSERAQQAKSYRDLATEISRLHPQALTRANGEEADHGPRKNKKGEEVGSSYPANFTKGLKHDKYGLLETAAHYGHFVEAINAPDPALFEKHVMSADDVMKATGEKFNCLTKTTCSEEEDVKWRGWESPRAGHVYELQGPDAGSVGMAPAPRVGSSELAAEMAEVYALALLRDVPFTTICEGGGKRLCASSDNPGEAELNAGQIVDLLNETSFYSGKDVRSSTPYNADDSGLNGFEKNRRWARTLGAKLTPANAFRGSTKGAHAGPYISQFMLIGADSIACKSGGRPSCPGTEAPWDLQDGFIPYGAVSIDQRTLTHKNCLDYMTDWGSWLDVQNGANFKGADQFEEKRRFITTPRDLATYVHFDALYEAYLNACLIMQALKVPASKGFPEPSPSGRRDAFATFGGPHILSLVCEVATRCLKAVRRQKFNYHRRARPEAMAGRFSLYCMDPGKLGCTAKAFEETLDDIPNALLEAVRKHNATQNEMQNTEQNKVRNVCCDAEARLPDGIDADTFAKCNLLLPMAFPEGSPMHPAYGAGHATVAGGCVTMLKAFFEMFEDCDSTKERGLRRPDGTPIIYEPNNDGSSLRKSKKFTKELTIQGELDKLAANISIGRNMAGVHYYSDYYDSLRMGERVAIGILMEQAPSYGEAMETSFTSFDGDLVTISGEGGSCPSLSVIGRDGNAISPQDWWLRHVSGQEMSLDL